VVIMEPTARDDLRELVVDLMAITTARQAMATLYCERVTFDGLMARLWASQHLAAQWFFNTMAFSQKRKP